MTTKIKKMIPLSAFAGLTLLVGGCTTPDLKPFADSTANLHQATVQTRDIIKAELREFKQQEIITNGDALAKGKHMPLTSLADAIKTHEIIFAADKSAATGKTVKL